MFGQNFNFGVLGGPAVFDFLVIAGGPLAVQVDPVFIQVVQVAVEQVD